MYTKFCLDWLLFQLSTQPFCPYRYVWPEADCFTRTTIGSAHAPTLVWLLFYSSAFKAFFLAPLCVQLFLFWRESLQKSPHPTVYFLRLPIFEFAIVFQLMLTCNDGNLPDLRPKTGKDLVVSHNQHSRVNIIVWGLHKELTTLEVRAN